MEPSSGHLNPGQKQTILFTFSPTHEKIYQRKFIIKISNNDKKLTINAKGQGTSVNLSVS